MKSPDQVAREIAAQTIGAFVDARAIANEAGLPDERLRGRVGSRLWQALKVWLDRQNAHLTRLECPLLTPERLLGIRWVEDPSLAPDAVVVEAV